MSTVVIAGAIRSQAKPGRVPRKQLGGDSNAILQLSVEASGYVEAKGTSDSVLMLSVEGTGAVLTGVVGPPVALQVI